MSSRPITLFLFLVSVHWYCKPQQELKSDALNRVILHKADTLYQFYAVKPTPKNLKSIGDHYYHWYKADTVLVTNKGFDGKLLHGDYIVYYPNKNLQEKGQFEYGLKTGEWKSWYDNGEMRRISNWKMGRQAGRFREYDRQGRPVRKGRYKGGELSGNMQEYANDTVAQTVRYRHGKPVIEKTKSDSTSQSKPAHGPQKQRSR